MSKGSAFFFEKKNQKTFIHFAVAPKGKSFFASFFSKKEDSSFLGFC
jgi:hypothetical protein